MKKKQKKKWEKPKLIILTRGKPEERVLAACKNDTLGGWSPNWNNCIDDTCMTDCSERWGS